MVCAPFHNIYIENTVSDEKMVVNFLFLQTTYSVVNLYSLC